MRLVVGETQLPVGRLGSERWEGGLGAQLSGLTSLGRMIREQGWAKSWKTHSMAGTAGKGEGWEAGYRSRGETANKWGELKLRKPEGHTCQWTSGRLRDRKD